MIVDGTIKPNAPGSLREPAVTYLLPTDWSTLPLSFGLLMSPWGGHAVFPNIYRDMRHPHRYGRSLQVTFGFTVGLLPMTSNILLTVPLVSYQCKPCHRWPTHVRGHASRRDNGKHLCDERLSQVHIVYDSNLHFNHSANQDTAEVSCFVCGCFPLS